MSFKNRERVVYVGMFGDAKRRSGTVVREFKSGVRVRWDDGRTDVVHPEDIRRT